MKGIVKSSIMWAVVAAACVLSVAPPCMAQIVLPDPGVDVAGHVTAVITDLGAVVLVAVGGYFAFLLIRMGLRWGRTALRG